MPLNTPKHFTLRLRTHKKKGPVKFYKRLENGKDWDSTKEEKRRVLADLIVSGADFATINSDDKQQANRCLRVHALARQLWIELERLDII